MQRKATLVKSLSNIVIHDAIESFPPSVHPVCIANKAEKKGGSQNRLNKQWVYKINKMDPNEQEEMKSKLLFDLTCKGLDSPAIKKYLQELSQTQGNIDECLDALANNQITNQSKLLIDVIVTEYISFMSGTRYKARTVADDKYENLLGKLNVSIPGLKTLYKLLDPELIGKQLEELQQKYHNCVQSNASPDEIEACRAQCKLMRAKKAVISQNSIYKVMTQQDEKQSMASFAQACIFIQRLDIGDITEKNIGLDNQGKVVLFDNDYALFDLQSELIDQSNKLDMKKIISQLDYSTIHQQPNRFEFLEDYSKDAKECRETFKKFAGENHLAFEMQVYRALLKEILCPDDFISELINAHTVSSQIEAGKLIKDFLILSKTKLTTQLMSKPDFVSYLINNSTKDIEGILSEFKQSQTFHHHYFDKNPQLKDTFISQIQTGYDKLLQQIKLPLHSLGLFAEASKKGASAITDYVLKVGT